MARLYMIFRDSPRGLVKNNGVKSQLLFIFLGLIIGVSSGYLLFRTPQSAPTPAPIEAEEATEVQDTQVTNRLTPEVLKKLEDLSEKEIEDYLKLRDQRARYEKAENILTQLLQILLVDLGVRIKQGQIAQLQDPNSRLALVETPVSTQPLPVQTPLASPTPARALPAKMAAAPSEWKKQGAAAAEVNGDAELKDFLKKVEISDLHNELRQTTSLSQAQLDEINGTFTGEVFMDDPKERPLAVELRLNGRIRNGQLQGTHFLSLAKDGKIFSRSSGRGNINDFMAISGDPNALIIATGGDNKYFQLYHFSKMGHLSGNYYQKASSGQYRKIGVVVLYPR